MFGTSTGPATNPVPVGEAHNVSKSFGQTHALVDCSLDVKAGECHALVGRNGAGKSTLVSLFTGLGRPDSGAIKLAGEPAPAPADRAAWLARVACVYQRSMVVPPLTVAENIFLNRPVGKSRSLVNWRRLRAEAHELMLEWGFDLDVDREASTLTVEQRQVVEIARALSIGARFLILDEPTAALEKGAVGRLFERVRRLREGGVGVLYISHHLEEIYEICQRVSVLRDGQLVLAGRVSDVSQGALIAAMVGSAPPRRATEIEATRKTGEIGEVALDVRQLNVASRSGSVYDLDLSVRGGECVGLVGLRGSGSATVGDAVAGLAKVRSGSITARGVIGYVPQDRHQRGFAPQLGVDENVTHAVLRRISGRFGIVSTRRRTQIARREVQRLQIVARALDQPVASLSGGNQQKVVVGRALAAEPAVLVAINPTVGVDVASKEALLDAIGDARDHGVAVLLISDDFDDLRVCTRLLVIVRGRLTAAFEHAPWDRQRLIGAMEALEVAV